MGPDIVIAYIEDSDLESLLADEMAIEGGHYIIGEPVDEVATWTWRRAVELYSKARALGFRGTSLMVMLDDFDVAIAERDQFRTDYELPAEYQNILTEHCIPVGDVQVIWGVQLRNRARGDLRKRLKPRIVIEEDGYFVSCGDNSYRQLTTGTTPICNLIMARHTKEKDRLFKYALNLYDMKWECQSKGGVAVSRVLYDSSITVFNIYITLSCQVGFAALHSGGQTHAAANSLFRSN